MGALYALITALLLAGHNLAVRRGVAAMDTGTGWVITMVVGAVASTASLLLPLPGRGAVMISWTAVLWFVGAGLCNTLVGRSVYFRSVLLLGPSRASAWKNATPLYTLILGFFLLGEHPGPLAVAGIAAVMAGLVLLSREQSRNVNQVRSGGLVRTALVLGVFSGLAFSVAMVFRKAGLNLWPDAAVGNAIGMVVAMVLYLPFAVAKGEFVKVTRAPRQAVAAMVVAGLFSTTATITTFLSLRSAMAATTQVITASEPLFTMALSMLLLKRQERLNAGLAASAALVCLGVVLMTR
ncbi:MAG TPA: DMT family transporter [Symbiobacteriaceae bacterium]|jgi:drug/metabolite transporter (DMT)-like permease